MERRNFRFRKFQINYHEAHNIFRLYELFNLHHHDNDYLISPIIRIFRDRGPSLR